MNVVIVGAGPAGLFLAHRLLALSPSHTVQLYDCNQNPTDLESFERGFGLGLGARIQRWLSSIEGLGEQLASDGLEFSLGGLDLDSTSSTLCVAVAIAPDSSWQSDL